GYTTNGNFTGAAIPSSVGYAWAVRDGDVLAIPEPEVYTLMLAGLMLVGVAARCRKQPAPAQFLHY
ncbi:MAG: PEP-CTERM sorting domain-containing protein, partial [Burkholderiaceae bacterium]|nr:PEP-CTERM sorting domain-containing protein [Burkholderiaceae bacterium]